MEEQKILKKLEQNRNNARLMQKVKEADKKQQEIKKGSYTIVKIALLIYILIVGLCVCNTLKNKGIQGCMENGYEYVYCVEHS